MSVSTPLPSFENPPEPEKPVANDTLLVPTSTNAVVPLPTAAKRPLKSAVTPAPYCSVPPANNKLPLLPTARSLSTLKVPCNSVTPPVNVFVPLKPSVPPPALMIDPAVVPPSMTTPPSVSRFACVKIVRVPPLKLTVPVPRFRLLVPTKPSSPCSTNALLVLSVVPPEMLVLSIPPENTVAPPDTINEPPVVVIVPAIAPASAKSSVPLVSVTLEVLESAFAIPSDSTPPSTVVGPV